MRAMPVATVASLLFCSLLVGCASMSEVLKNKDEGTAKVYKIKPARAWDAAMTVLRWEGCETIEEHKSDMYMLTTVGQNFVSAGSLVGVWVEPAGGGTTKVTVVTKRKIQTNIATGLTETTFHDRFAQAVRIVQSGKPLPVEPPSNE